MIREETELALLAPAGRYQRTSPCGAYSSDTPATCRYWPTARKVRATSRCSNLSMVSGARRTGSA
jgi:hypothetical protein